MFVNYFGSETRESPINLAAARFVLGGYLIRKTIWYNWEIVAETPFRICGSYAFAIPSSPTVLVAERWMLIGLLLAVMVAPARPNDVSKRTPASALGDDQVHAQHLRRNDGALFPASTSSSCSGCIASRTNSRSMGSVETETYRCRPSEPGSSRRWASRIRWPR